MEFHAGADGDRPYPIEYKRGSPKAHRADEVQLCAQALCLEAMFGRHVEEGALFYGKPRRRQVVEFDSELRKLTLETIRGVREMIAAGHTPPAKFEAKRCNACSLLDLCQPRLSARANGVNAWLARQLQDE
jgi:CRISPR-associated exonuclease Cas4